MGGPDHTCSSPQHAASSSSSSIDEKKSRGFDSRVRHTVVSMIDEGRSAAGIRVDLHERYKDEAPHLLEHIPDQVQIENLQSRMKKRVTNLIGITVFADLQDYITDHTVKTQEAYDAISNLHEMIILANYVTELGDSQQGHQPTYLGFCYTCKHLLEKNLRPQFEAAKRAVNSDCTFKLINGDWTHGSLGGITVYRPTREAVARKYCPYMFAISKTEREETYAAMFQGVDIALEFMGLDSSEFYYSSAASDNCDGFYNALKTYNDPKTDLYGLPRKCAIVLLCCLLFYYLLFSAAFITLCWPHIARTALSHNRSKFCNPGYEEVAQRDINFIHSCRSRKQEDIMTVMMLTKWIADGESPIADYWRKHVHKERRYISAGATDIAGHDAENQPPESMHRDMKRGIFGADKGSKFIIRNHS